MRVLVCGDRNLKVEPYPADWSIGRAAGPIRNKRMIVEGKPDLVVAFHDSLETSRRTRNMINQAISAGIPVAHYNSSGFCRHIECLLE